MTRLLAVCTILVSGLPAALHAGQGEAKAVSGRLNFYSVEKELALGKALALEVARQARLVDDPMVAEYVNRLGQNLARDSGAAFPLSFRVIASDEINAFTLPGGHVFIHTGLIRLTANEAQLAAVIAHELGHAAARHATRQASRNQLLGMSTLPLTLFGGWGALAGRQAAAVALPMAYMKFSREFENEADLLGLDYLSRAGYDPNASVELFETLESTEKRNPGAVARLFHAHPLTSDRIEKTQKNIDRMPATRDAYALNTSEYEAVRTRLGALPPADGTR